MNEQTVGFFIALILAPILGWPVWLVLIALKRCFDIKTKNYDFSMATPEELTVSLITIIGEAGYIIASKLEEFSWKGKKR